jgi:class 3 adenylate cyclase
VTRTFVFTDIVSSTDLAGSLGDATWQGVMAWHDRTLRAAFVRHGGVEVRHTGDGFFAAFESAQAALDCAVEIQRLLEANRREHGSALTVRIGLHLASALKHEGDYAGQGVHVAARVAALGGRDEIVASRSVVDAVGERGFDFAPPRSVSVKGVAEPIVVQNVGWG